MKTALATRPSVRRVLVPSAVLALAIIGAMFSGTDSRIAAAPNEARNAAEAKATFNAGEELLLPTGYRKWVYVGTPITPHDMNGGKAGFPEFHAVYINPDAYDQYEATGEFPDGTVLVKELISVGSKQASSGKGYFMGEFIGLEVSVKDATRFKDEPGNWAFFSFGHEYPLATATKAQSVANCNACHGGVADEDYVFTQYYPVLRAAKSN